MRKLVLILAFLFLTIGIASCGSQTVIDVTFEENGGAEVEDIQISLTSTTVDLPTSSRDGYTFDGWYLDEGLTQPFTLAALLTQNGVLVLYAKWIEETNTVTITFEESGGSAVLDITQDFNTAVTAPNNPTKEGYTFGGWYSDVELTTAYTFTVMPAQNITLYAKWTIIQYTITFEESGGSAVLDITQDFNTAVTAPNNPTKEGYTFGGWYSDAALTTAYTFTVMPAQNITLYAKWTIIQYTITFEENGGSAVLDITQDFNTAVTAPNNPNKEGYTFGGWYSDAALTTAYTFTVMPAQNITLYAKWTIIQYTITFEESGGSAVLDITQDFNTAVTAPNNPTKEGYTFGGWYSDAALTTAYTFTVMPAQNITLYAKWTIIQYTITFEENGGSAVLDITQDFNTAVTAPNNPTKEGYTFGGWYSDVELTTAYTFTVMPAQNITLYAKWTIIQYTITFEENGGSAVLDITQDFNTAVTAPNNPTKEGYTFGGWYSDAALTTAYTFTVMPAQNITLYAKWTIIQYTITFEESGGSAVLDITQDFNTAVTAPNNPTKEGYTFGGWYSDVELTTAYTFTVMPAQNITLYAKWTIIQYTITFEENGGSAVLDITQDFNTAVTAPNNPNKEGYTFGGWYSDAALTTAYTFTVMPAQNITLYAKWTIIQYTITFEESGGSAVLDITQDFNTAVTAPNNSNKEGYTFGGWYSDVELTTAYTFTVMPAQNITLYAKWTINQVISDFDNATIVNDGEVIQVEITLENNAIFYIFTPTVSGNYRIFSTGDQDTYVYLCNQNEEVVNSDDDSGLDYNFDLIYFFEIGQTYYIVVQLYDEFETGSFTWSLQQVVSDFNNATAVNVGDINLVDVTIIGSDYYYQFTTSSSGYFEIYSEGDQDTYVSIYNQNEVLLETNDDGGLDYNFGLIYYFEENQIYYIVVELYDYLGNEDFDSAVIIDAETINVGAILYSESRIYYKFIPTQTGYYNVESPSNQILCYELYDAQHVWIGYKYFYDDYYGNLSDIELELGITYYLAVMFDDENLTGNLDFMIHYLGDSNINLNDIEILNTSTTSTQIDLALNETLYMQVNVEDDGYYVINYQCDFPLFIGLFDENFHHVTHTYLWDFSLDFEAFALTTYYLVIVAANMTDFGLIDLNINNLSPENTSFETAEPLIYSSVTEYSIYYQDDLSLYFEFTVPETGLYQFFSSGDYDLYLEIYGSDLTYQDSDDDGGEGLNFSLDTYLESGVTYYFVIMFFEYDGLIDFQLHMLFSNHTNTDFVNATSIQSDIMIVDSIMINNEILYYQFVPNITGYYHVSSTSVNNLVMSVYDSEEVFIGYNYLYEYYANFDLIHFISGNIYYVTVESFDGLAVDFDFMIFYASDTQPLLINAQPVLENEIIETQIVTMGELPYYVFAPLQTGYYYIEYTSNIVLYIEIYDENGYYINSICYGDIFLSAYLNEGQLYYIVVMSWHLEDDDQSSMLINYVDYSNTDFDHALTITNGNVFDVYILDEWQTLFYLFIPTASGYYYGYTIGEMYTFINVYDENYELLYSADSSWDHMSYYFEIYYEVGETYYFELGSDELGRFSFGLHQGELININPEDAINVICDQEVSEIVLDYGVSLYYELSPIYTGYYQATVGGSYPLRLYVYDELGNLVPYIEENYTEEITTYQYYLHKENIYLFVIGFDSSYDFGQMLFSITLLENMQDNFDSAYVVHDLDTVTIEIVDNSTEYFEITPDESGEYILYATGEGDIQLVIYDVDGQIIQMAEPEGTDGEFYYSYYLEAGVTYYYAISIYTYYTNHSFIFSWISGDFGFDFATPLYKNDQVLVEIDDYNSYECYQFQPTESEVLMIFSMGIM